MTTICELPFSLRALFGLWAFLLCCTGVIGIVLSVFFKRYRYALVSIAAFAPAYLLWQVIFNISGIVKNLTVGASVNASRVLSGLPWFVWVLALLVFSFAALWSIHLNIRYSRTHITPFAIKLCGDKMSCGICYWADNGRVIFFNDCMNRLCLAITGSQLLNGNSFRDAVSGGSRVVGTEVWSFTFRDVTLGGRLLHEMVALDITETYAKTESLRRGNERLARMTEELKTFSLRIDDVVRRQEILQAKINIHDEMNHLMLITVAADQDDTEALDRIFTQWQKNALILCMEAEEPSEQNAVEKLEQFAQLLGIMLHWNGSMPAALTENQQALFFTAAQEAVVNAVKHGEAERVDISFTESGTGIGCAFENNGRIPAGGIRFTGGLANLSLLAAEQEAVLSAETGETFKLQLLFPKKS